MPPQPFPYQGSKRRLAPQILPHLAKARPRRVIEPFAGSAAITIAAAEKGVGERALIADTSPGLATLWRAILEDPEGLLAGYRARWEVGDYDAARRAFNAKRGPERRPEDLLYLLCRCVKGAVRFNQKGQFNQAADKRRKGMHPDRLSKAIERTSALLRYRALVRSEDYEEVVDEAGRGDVIYCDPPYAGTTNGKDRRYAAGLDEARFIGCLERLRARGVPFAVSYDGRLGEKTYGACLPAELGLTRLDLDAGRSAQATLLGRDERTVESLYLSPEIYD